MGTISPDESIAIGNGVEGLGGKYLEAPILGSTSEAEAGQLKVMVGSSKKRFDQWKPLLNCFCEEAIYVGEVGKAAEWLALEGYDPQFGARPVKRVMQRDLLNELSKEILAGNIQAESNILLDLKDGELSFISNSVVESK